MNLSSALARLRDTLRQLPVIDDYTGEYTRMDKVLEVADVLDALIRTLQELERKADV